MSDLNHSNLEKEIERLKLEIEVKQLTAENNALEAIQSRKPFDVALTDFLALLTTMVEKHKQANYPNNPSTIFSVEMGSKYAKVVSAWHGSRSVYCFVEKSNGDILKPAGWKAPAKTARGSIYNENPLKGCGPNGVAYLR